MAKCWLSAQPSFVRMGFIWLSGSVRLGISEKSNIQVQWLLGWQGQRRRFMRGLRSLVWSGCSLRSLAVGAVVDLEICGTCWLRGRNVWFQEMVNQRRDNWKSLASWSRHRPRAKGQGISPPTVTKSTKPRHAQE